MVRSIKALAVNSKSNLLNPHLISVGHSSLNKTAWTNSLTRLKSLSASTRCGLTPVLVNLVTHLATAMSFTTVKKFKVSAPKSMSSSQATLQLMEAVALLMVLAGQPSKTKTVCLCSNTCPT